ncbi:hypothetical protein L1987_54046 [Smallanthus sonchifolius]|uniref:Uncharacterized protein n=1 Tax=Smallanthus sonchifolius TaxID=185202 RepID=A0ACB9E6C6_9ASTR|nr:hypothetical protein L1987_54046 [Smallanthus sonchifolius]
MFFCVASKFEELSPARSDTDKRIEPLLEIPVDERSFQFESTVGEASLDTECSEATISSSKISFGFFRCVDDSNCSFFTKIPRSSSQLALDDVNSLIFGSAIVKQETPAPVVIKPKIPNLRSKTSGSKKRKSSDVDLEVFEGIDPAETTKKMRSLMNLGLDKLSSDLEATEKKADIVEEKIEDMKKIAAVKSQFKEKEISDLKKESEASKLLHLKEIEATME